jgi:hypothetical protein
MAVLCGHREWTQLAVELASPYTRSRNRDKGQHLLTYYTRPAFWRALAVRDDEMRSMQENFRSLTSNLLSRQCIEPNCPRLRISQSSVDIAGYRCALAESGSDWMPMMTRNRGDFTGSCFCVAHHQRISSSPMLWFFLDPNVESNLPSFRAHCEEKGVASIFLCFKDCVQYRGTKDRAERVRKGLAFVRAYLQVGVPLSVVSEDPDDDEQAILQGIIEEIKKPRFSAGLFKQLAGRLRKDMHRIFSKFKQSQVCC